MTDWTPIGKWLVIAGIALILLGGALILGSQIVNTIPWLGHLPGDIHIERRGLSCYVPLATSILISLLLTVALNIAIRLLRRH